MSKEKNLLSESQIRQFMKLAQLTPLAPGFVDGLTEATGDEELEERRVTRPPGGGPGGGGTSHGRSSEPMPNNKELMREEDLEDELHATEDELGAEDHVADEEGAELDDLEADDGADVGRMVSVDDFLSALESALEGVIGDEVEIDAEELDGDEVEADVELDAELDMGADDDVEVDVEDEMLAEEEGSKKGEYLRKDKEGKVGKRRGDVDGGKYGKGGHYKAKYEESVDELTEEEGSKKGEYKRRGKSKKHPVGHRAGDVDGHYKAFEKNESTEATDELVEQITKRVAARILKSALAKK